MPLDEFGDKYIPMKPSPQYIWLPIFVNKVLLKHGHAHLFTCCLIVTFMLQWQEETIWSAKLKIFTVWLFTEKICHSFL